MLDKWCIAISYTFIHSLNKKISRSQISLGLIGHNEGFSFLSFLFRFHIWGMSFNISPLSDLRHSVWQSLGPSMLLQMYFILFNGRVMLHCIYVPHLLYPLLCDGHLGCFHILAVVNSAAVNIGVHVSFWIIFFFFPGYMPRVGLQGHMVALFLVFKGTSILFYIVTLWIYISTKSLWGQKKKIFFYLFIF